MSAPRFPWEEAMTLGLGTLRLPPPVFWRMTLPELSAAARALQAQHTVKAMKKVDLTKLMQNFPDARDGKSSIGDRQ